MICKGKVAIVTGGASGIGRAAAIAFAREGACVTVADRDRVCGEEIVKYINETGSRAIFVETDVTSEAAIALMVEKTVGEFGGLDMAFNNAGAPGRGSTVLSCTKDEWDSLIRINMTSVWMCMKYEIQEMLKRGGGAIVNTSSRAGDSAPPNMFAYIATKHAVVGMTRSAAIDLADRNIRVNALMPGFTDTPLLRTVMAGAGSPPLETMAQSVIPMKRPGKPEEQGEAAVWLCSDHAAYMTGTVMVIDGGMSAVS